MNKSQSTVEMEENCVGEFENILTCVYTITNDPSFCSLGFKPQCLSKVLKRKTAEESSAIVIYARKFLSIPMDAALHFIVVTLLVFIVINLACKLLLHIFM